MTNDWVIRIAIMIVWAVLFYWLKNQHGEIKDTKQKVNKHQLDINGLRGSLWSEEKFRTIITESNTMVVNQIKILLFEEGVLKAKKDKE